MIFCKMSRAQLPKLSGGSPSLLRGHAVIIQYWTPSVCFNQPLPCVNSETPLVLWAQSCYNMWSRLKLVTLFGEAVISSFVVASIFITLRLSKLYKPVFTSLDGDLNLFEIHSTYSGDHNKNTISISAGSYLSEEKCLHCRRWLVLVFQSNSTKCEGLDLWSISSMPDYSGFIHSFASSIVSY